MKQEKRMKQYQEELKLKQMKNSDTPSLSVERMTETKAPLKTPYLVLSGHVKPGQTSDPRSGFATVEKDLPGGLTPMLGDKKPIPALQFVQSPSLPVLIPIYIGTYSGSLLLLTTDTDSESNHDDDASMRKVSFMRSVSIGDYPVEAVLALAQIGKVVVISDGCLLLVDSLLDQQLKKLGFAKGVSAIAKRINGVVKATQQTEDSSNNVFAIVLGGKKIVLAELVFGSDSGPGKNEGALSGVNGSLVVLKEIQSSVEGIKAIASPLLKLLWKEKNVLLRDDNVGVVVNDHGQPVDGSLVFCGGHPQSIGKLSSYVVIVRDGKLELYHKKSGSCLQTVVFGGEGVGSCLIADKEGGYDKLITIATSTKVLCYRKVPNEEQIKDLLRKKNFKEAMSLVEELECEGEIGNEMLSFIHALVGFQLLFDLHFEEAVEHFLQSETMQPSEIFPFILRDPNRWSLLDDLHKSIDRARKLALKKQKDAVVGPEAIACLATTLKSNQMTDDQNAATEEGQEGKVVFTEIEEFVWGLQFDEDANKADTKVVFKDEDDATAATLEEREDTDAGLTEANETVKDEDTSMEDAKEVTPDEIIHEAPVGKGLSGALKLLHKQGTLKESIN
ncbi:Vacuolar sorting protein 3 [Linum grandiflorum]